VVPGVTVGQLNYANQQDLFSDATFQLSGFNVPANQSLSFYLAGLQETGQGFVNPLTISQGNSKFSKGQPPANQVFIGTHFGFGVAFADTNDPAEAAGIRQSLFSANDAFAIISAFSWDLQIGNGITRTIGALLEYPDVGGAWAESRNTLGGEAVTFRDGAQNGVPACHKVKLPIPIVFPPLINVNISAACGNGFTLLDGGTTVEDQFVSIRATLSGFLMTMPV
jgi:hypothetical protein